MRGVADGEYLNPDFFIVMDRLFGTLDQRLNAWKKVLDKNSGVCCGIGQNHDVFRQILKERMIVAYDLAVDFMYLHENRLVTAQGYGLVMPLLTVQCPPHSCEPISCCQPPSLCRLVYRDIKVRLAHTLTRDISLHLLTISASIFSRRILDSTSEAM